MQKKSLLTFRSNDLRYLPGGPKVAGLKSPPPVIGPIFALIDANVLLSIISCKAQFRSHTARTNLEEAVDAGILRAFATAEAREEVIKNLPTFSSKASPERREKAKEAIFNKIHFIAPVARNSANIQRLQRRDPTDVPHAQLFEELGLDVILSKDNDWNATQYPRLGLEDADLVLLLRDYARAAAEHLGLHSLISTGTVLSIATLQGMWGFFSKLSTPMKLLVGGISLVAAASFAASTQNNPTPPPQALSPDWPLKGVFEDWHTSGARSLGLSSEIEKLIRRQQKLTLSQHILRVLALSSEPLSSSDIEKELFRSGYKSRSKHFRTQLLRSLKSNRNVAARNDGRWQLHAQIKIEETEFSQSVRNFKQH